MENALNTIAIVGFPETGKTKIKEHLETPADLSFAFTELPGVVMLGRNTPSETETYDFLLGRGKKSPFGIIAVADASDLERQLYLAFQLIDLRLPLVLCITGEARAKGVTISTERLSSMIGVPVLSIPTSGDKLQSLMTDWSATDVEKVKRKPEHWRPSVALANAYQHLDSQWIHKHLGLYTGARLVEGLRLLTVPGAVEEYEVHPAYKSLLRYLDEAREILEEKNVNWTTVEVIQRSKWIGQTFNSAVTRTADASAMQATDEKSWLKWWRGLFKAR